MRELLALIEAEATDAIVIGLPINLDGEESLTTRQVRNFSKSLARRTTLPLFWMEEALSSYEAERDLRDARTFRSSRPGRTRPAGRRAHPAIFPRSTGSQTENHMNDPPKKPKTHLPTPAPRAQKKQAYLPAYRIHGINRLLRINNIPMRHPPKQRTGSRLTRSPARPLPLMGRSRKRLCPLPRPRRPNPNGSGRASCSGSCCWSCWLAAEPVGWPMTS